MGSNVSVLPVSLPVHPAIWMFQWIRSSGMFNDRIIWRTVRTYIRVLYLHQRFLIFLFAMLCTLLSLQKSWNSGEVWSVRWNATRLHLMKRMSESLVLCCWNERRIMTVWLTLSPMCKCPPKSELSSFEQTP